MPSSEAGRSFLGDFHEFLSFLKSLWGLLAGFSLFFPLSNDLLKVVPLERFDAGSLRFFSPAGVTTVTTVVCLFATLWTFGQRGRMKMDTRRRIYRRAWLGLAGGLVSLLAYWSFHFLIVGGFYYGVLGWESSDLRLVVGDLALTLLYLVFFALLTRSFLLLALAEYLGVE